jgi:hypothetical protein
VQGLTAKIAVEGLDAMQVALAYLLGKGFLN